MKSLEEINALNRGSYIQLNGSEKNPGANDIVFVVANGLIEILRFCANGDIFVKGRKIVNDQEIVEGFRSFLKLSNQYTKSPRLE